MRSKLPYVVVIGLLGLFYSFIAFECLEVVSVKDRQLIIDEVPYYIKGICYNPVEKGYVDRDFNNLDLDLALMNEAGINTMRVYKPIIEVAVLDKIAAAGIKVITSFGYNQDGHYDIVTGTYLDYINSYKNHKAILLWELGNEYNYHPECRFMGIECISLG